MKWIVLGVGLATAVLGGWWTWFGLSIVQVERGWSAVIAGSVLVAAGLVIMAIAALMQRVDALSHALSSLRISAPDRAETSVGAAEAVHRREIAAAPVDQAAAEAPSATASPAREADILAAVGAALEFSPSVATDTPSERPPTDVANKTDGAKKDEPGSSETDVSSPSRMVAPGSSAAPAVKPTPAYVRPGQDVQGRSPPPPRRITATPTPTSTVAPKAPPAPPPTTAPTLAPTLAPTSKPPRAPVAGPLPKDETNPSGAQSGRPGSPRPVVGNSEQPKDGPDETASRTMTDPAEDTMLRPSVAPGDEKSGAQIPGPAAPEPRIENARAASDPTDAPAVISPAHPARDSEPSPMLGPVLSAPQDGDGPKRKPSSFGWLEKARQRDQLRARKADENTSDAPPVLSPGAPALDEPDREVSARSQAPAPAPEPALDAAKPSEADAPAHDDADAAERDVPGALAEAPVIASGEGAGSRLVRRYDSQGVKYNLYEDGTIEAESESGMYRFASLAELRAFLEKRA